MLIVALAMTGGWAAAQQVNTGAVRIGPPAELHYLDATTIYGNEVQWGINVWAAFDEIAFFEETAEANADLVYSQAPFPSRVLANGRIVPGAAGFYYPHHAIVFNSIAFSLRSDAENQKTAAHETGHALGIDHLPSGNVMGGATGPGYPNQPTGEDFEAYCNIWGAIGNGDDCDGPTPTPAPTFTPLPTPDPALTPTPTQTPPVSPGSTGTLRIIKLDNQGAAFEGFCYDLIGPQGASIGGCDGLGDDPDGVVTFTFLVPGEYTVTETTAPDGYAINADPQVIQIEGGRVFNALFYPPPYGNISVDKVDENGAPLGGFCFELVDSTGAAQAQICDDEDGGAGDGTVLFGRVDPGAYTVREVDAPQGYIVHPDSQAVTVEAGLAANVVFALPESGRIRIVALAANGDALPGACFRLTSYLVAYEEDFCDGGANDLDGDADGTLVAFVPADTYQVDEISPPAGYAPTNLSRTVELRPGRQATLNVRYFGSLRIVTVDDEDSPLGGTCFDITGPDENTVERCDNEDGDTSEASGELLLADLKPGDYVLEQSSVPGGHLPDPQPVRTVKVIPEQTVSATFVGAEAPPEPTTGDLRIRRQSLGGDPLGGACFEIFGWDGSDREVCDGDEGVDADSDEGEVLLLALAPGSYDVIELNPPPGYLPDEETRTTAVAAGGEGQVTFASGVEPTQEPTTLISLTKLNCEEDPGAVDAFAAYQGSVPEGCVVAPGVEFDVTDATSGSYLGHLATDGSGRLTFIAPTDHDISLDETVDENAAYGPVENPTVFTVCDCNGQAYWVVIDYPRTTP